MGRTGLGDCPGQHEGIDAAPRGQVVMGEAGHELALVRQQGEGLRGLEPLRKSNKPADDGNNTSKVELGKGLSLSL